MNRNWALAGCVGIGLAVVYFMAPAIDPFLFGPFLHSFPGGKAGTPEADAVIFAGAAVGAAKFALAFLIGFAALRVIRGR